MGKRTGGLVITNDRPQQFDRIEIRQATHSYRAAGEENNFMLGPIDLTIDPREILFIVGGNGSGKSTLAKLLTGLYLPDSGEIRLNGISIDDLNRERYRQLFSTVFADFYLFDRHIHITRI